VLVNLTAGWRVTDAWSLRARIENLFDEDYELVDGYNTAGFGVHVSVRYAPQGLRPQPLVEQRDSDAAHGAYSTAAQ